MEGEGFQIHGVLRPPNLEMNMFHTWLVHMVGPQAYGCTWYSRKNWQTAWERVERVEGDRCSALQVWKN